MTENKSNSHTDWVDDDDAPEWTQDQFDRAEIRFGSSSGAETI